MHSLTSQPLDNSRSTHASANAHRDNAILATGPLQLRHQGCDLPGTCAAERVAESDRTSLRVQLLLRNTQILHAVRGLACEGLIDFEHVDVLDGEASHAEGCRDGDCRANAHDLRGNSDGRKRDESANNRKTKALSSRASGHEDKSGTVRDLRGVTRSCGAPLLEGGLQLLQTRHSGGGADSLVGVDNLLDHIFGTVGSGGADLGSHGHNLLSEESCLLGLRGLGVRLHRHSVLRVSGDSVLGSNILGSDAHGKEAVACTLVLEDILGDLLGIQRCLHIVVGHALNPPPDPNVDVACLDLCSDVGTGLEARGALAVDGHHGNISGPAGEQLPDSRGQGAATGLKDVADTHVSHILGVDPRALDKGLKEGGEHVFGHGVLEAALLGLAHGSADSAADDDVIRRGLGRFDVAGDIRDSLHFFFTAGKRKDQGRVIESPGTRGPTDGLRL
mmetsp:Transcript_18571/g.37575  ORF Transcript_18571/g.37575 Transcript_18571/m.37575 type:complete len:447 (+) Transcript_18571:799-2139(+)